MFTLGLIFYGFVGLCIAGFIMKLLGLDPDQAKKQAPTTESAPVLSTALVPIEPTTKPENKADTFVKLLFILALTAGCVIGVPWALASWGGERYGNPMYPKNQPVQSFVPAQSTKPGLIWVNGYYKNDGTYVQGHYRTEADGDTTNNLNPSYKAKR